jgi:hypothetical protein
LSRLHKAVIAVGLVAIAGSVAYVAFGRQYLRKRTYMHAATNACACLVGKPSPLDTDELIDAIETTVSIDPSPEYRDWPARCKGVLVTAMAAYRDYSSGKTIENEKTIVDGIERGSLGVAKTFIGELRGMADENPDSGIRLAPPPAKPLIDLLTAEPFLDPSAQYPIDAHVEQGRLELTFDFKKTNCSIEVSGQVTCAPAPQKGWRLLEHETGAPLLYWSPNADEADQSPNRKRSGNLVDVHGDIKASLDSFAWGRTFRDGHALLANESDEVFRMIVNERKVTHLPPLPQPRMLLRQDNRRYFDHWAIQPHTNGVSAVDLEKQPFKAIEVESERLPAPNELSWSTCSANASYVDVGGRFAIVTKDTWTFQPLDQSAHRHVFCAGDAAVVTDYLPLTIERCDDVTCTSMPTGALSGTTWDKFAADVEHVWQLDTSKGFLVVRVWPHAHREKARSVALANGWLTSRRWWGMNAPPPLHVLKGRAFLIVETKKDTTVIIAIDAQGHASIIKAK